MLKPKTSGDKYNIDFINYSDGVAYESTKDVFTNTNFRSAGQIVPGYKRIIAAGGDATSPLSGIKQSGAPADYTAFADVTYSDGRVQRYKSVGALAISNPSPDTKSSVYARASADFQSKAAEAMRQFDAGSFIGELGETVRMIRHPLQSLANGMSHFRNTVKNRAKRRPSQYVTDTWLEYVYGWKPLLNDVDSAMKALASINTGQQRAPVTGGHDEDFLDEEVRSATYANRINPYGSWAIVGTRRSNHSCKIHGQVILKNVNDNGSMPTYAERMGVGLDQFIPTLYNLIPFSFVVDYFSNVGNVITAVTNYRCTYAWSCTTYRITTRTQACIVDSGYRGGLPSSISANVWINSGSFNNTATKFDRSSGIPPLSFESVYFDVPSLSQVFNLGALINSLRK